MNKELERAIAMSDLEATKDAFAKWISMEDKIEALLRACENGSSKITNYLLDEHLPIDIANYDGITPLMCVARAWGSVKMIQDLVDRGADIHVKSKKGDTALMFASCDYVGEMSVVSNGGKTNFLLEIGADIETKNNSGATPLINAAASNSTSLIVLIEKVANINAAKNDGKTGLMFACWNGHEYATTALLEHGADTSITDNEGKTARDYAVKDKQTKIIEILDNHEKKKNVAVYNKQLLQIEPRDITAPENAEILKEIVDKKILAECFEGLDYERQNALLIATAKDVMADAELAKQIQTIMQKTLTKERAGAACVTQIKLFNIIEANTINVKA